MQSSARPVSVRHGDRSRPAGICSVVIPQHPVEPSHIGRIINQYAYRLGGHNRIGQVDRIARIMNADAAHIAAGVVGNRRVQQSWRRLLDEQSAASTVFGEPVVDDHGVDQRRRAVFHAQRPALPGRAVGDQHGVGQRRGIALEECQTATSPPGDVVLDPVVTHTGITAVQGDAAAFIAVVVGKVILPDSGTAIVYKQAGANLVRGVTEELVVINRRAAIAFEFQAAA